ncbi:hypothetical protein SLA2020_407130 [Shorea laevis]
MLPALSIIRGSLLLMKDKMGIVWSHACHACKEHNSLLCGNAWARGLPLLSCAWGLLVPKFATAWSSCLSRMQGAQLLAAWQRLGKGATPSCLVLGDCWSPSLRPHGPHACHTCKEHNSLLRGSA